MKKLLVLLIAALALGSVSSFAQKAKQDTVKHIALYTCPMHPDVKLDKPGKCPQCGMDLTLSNKEEMKRVVTKAYTCPVHADVVSAKPGKCPQCKKKLVLSKEEMKMEVMKTYTCPMHPDVTSDKIGKCPKCGMELTAIKAEKDKPKNK